MSTQITLHELLQVTQCTYESVELRTIAANINGLTHNLVTLIQFSTEPNDSGAAFTPSGGRSLVPDGPLWFGQVRAPITQWQEIASQSTSGELEVGEHRVALGAAIGLNAFTGQVMDGGGYVASTFPTFQGALESVERNTELGRTVECMAYNPETMKQLSRSGFRNFSEFTRDYLGTSDRELSGASKVVIVAPVPLIIEHVEVLPTEQKIRAHVRLHPKLTDSTRMIGEIEVAGGFNWSRHKDTVTFGPWTAIEPGRVYADALLSELDPQDFIGLSLVHDRIGIVHNSRFSLKQATPAAYLNPMFEVFKRFCSAADLSLMLTEPGNFVQKVQKDVSRPQRSFEQYVQWLLSCFGFAAVQLGAKEYLYGENGAPGSKMRIGSLDLLAFHAERKLLLLGSCTANPPKEEDYANLLNLRAALMGDLGTAAGIEVALVIFTMAERCLPSNRYSAQDAIAVFDKPRLSQIVEQLNCRNEEALFTLFSGGAGEREG